MDIKDIKLSALSKPVSKFLHRFHAVLFVIVALGGLAFVIFSLYSTIVRASDSTGMTTDTPIVFDQQTIDELDRLHRASNPSSVKLPGGRINPFVE